MRLVDPDNIKSREDLRALLHARMFDQVVFFSRALGMFLLLMAIVPMSAAFMKAPVSRILIPLWWYPVLTVAMFWVAKPYLFRDWAAWLVKHPGLISAIAVGNFIYGLAICTCAGLFW